MTTPLDDLKRAEGSHVEHGRHTLYKCPADKWTIGYGRNLEARGLSDDEAEMLAVNDIAQNVKTCIGAFGIEAWNNLGATTTGLAGWNNSVTERQWWIFSIRHRALLELAHGLGGFADFPGVVRAIKAGDFDLAGDEMEFIDPTHPEKGRTKLWRDWHGDREGGRARRLQRWIKTGKEEL